MRIWARLKIRPFPMSEKPFTMIAELKIWESKYFVEFGLSGEDVSIKVTQVNRYGKRYDVPENQAAHVASLILAVDQWPEFAQKYYVHPGETIPQGFTNQLSLFTN